MSGYIAPPPIAGTAIAPTSIQVTAGDPGIDTAAAGALNLASVNATSVNIDVATVIDAGGITVTGGIFAANDPGAGVAAETGLTNGTGVGNGAQTAVTSPLIGTGNGPANGQVVTNFIKVYIGAAVRWIPVMS